MHIGFSDEDGAGIREPGNDGGIFFGNKVGQYPGTTGCLHSSGKEQVFGGKRNAVQWSAISAFDNFTLSLPRSFPGMPIQYGDKRIEFFLDAFTSF